MSDFGLARLTSDADTHVTTRVMGTFGYLTMLTYTKAVIYIYILATRPFANHVDE